MKKILWLRILSTALTFYVFSILVLGVTQNIVLFPTVILLGSFMVPIAYVAFFYERRHTTYLPIATVLLSFFYGGVVGVILTSTIEPIVVQNFDTPNFFLVGIVEEFSKIFAVYMIAKTRKHDSELSGIILGAATGMGYAALESMGYGFVAFLQSHGSISFTQEIILFRGLLSPIGHGTWTAILAGVLFRESSTRRFVINSKVTIAYLGVATLHGLWDSLPGILDGLVLSGLDYLLSEAVVGLAGIFILRALWRQAKRRQSASTALQ